MKKTLFTIALFSGLLITFTSCEKDDPEKENEEELITDIVLTFTELDGNGNETGTPLVYTASDTEGIELGGSPEIDDIDGLEAGKTYSLSIEVLNSIEDEDITEEIEEEADEHQFFFLGNAFGASGLGYTYSDEDGEGNPIGLEGRVTVSANATGTASLRVVLRHALDKSTEGADNPNWANYAEAGGESDLDVTFPVIF